jgi:hypothetical protein
MIIFLALGLDFVLRVIQKRAYGFQVRRLAKVSSGISEKKLVRNTSDDTETIATVETETVQTKENLARWWTLLGGVVCSSAMIILRG